MINLKSKRFTLAAAIASTLTACGGTGQDDGSGKAGAKQTFSGKAIDGYVARAQVFLDTNNNGTRDAWEPRAFTDNDGYFGENPDTGIDYCADKTSELYDLHCLVSNTAYKNAVIRIKGGYDLSTGEPFLGQISRRIDNAEAGAVKSVLITPLTSLLAEVEQESERDKLLDALGIEKSDLDVDYFKSGDINSEILKKSLVLHKAVTLISSSLNETYDEMGKGFGVSDDASSSVYKAMVKALSKELASNPVATDQTDYVDVLLKSKTFLTDVFEASEQEVRQIYEDRKLDLPSSIGQSSGVNSLLERVKTVPDITQSLLSNDTPTQQELTSGVKALEALVLKVVGDKQGGDVSVERAIDLLIQDGQVRDNLLSALEQPGADLNTLAESDFVFSTSTDFTQSFVNNAELPSLINKTITLSDESKKYNQSNGTFQFKDSQIILYIQGADGADSGKITACVKYIEDAKFDESADEGKQVKLGDSNTTGELITGQWAKLDARQLLVRAKYLGSDYQWLIKPKGNDRYQFDFDGKLTIWQADMNENSEALSDLVIEELPKSNSDCKQRLPLRLDDITL